MGEGDKDDEEPLSQLIQILEQPEKRILPLLYESSNPQDQKIRKETRSQLVHIAQHLFGEIETIAKKYRQVTKAPDNEDDNEEEKKEDLADLPGLSGLPQLYVPEGSEGNEDLDTETLWGQVELQNNALRTLAKKATKRLAKAPEKIVLLDMGQISSDEDGDGSEDDEDNSSAEEGRSDADSAQDEDEDEDARRIRERMERAMEDMESDEDGEEEEQDESDADGEDEESSQKEQLYDPVAEEMKDGFFNLNEMEDFADEEEDFLPDEAYGQPKPEKSKSKSEEKSFHQKQRDGSLLNQSDDEDDDDLDDLYEDPAPVRRKKYRDDEDIDALYNLYQNGKEEDSEQEDAINMTAADFFGQPNRDYMARYSAKKAKEEVKGDDDSWGEYDFEKEEDGAGWRDESAEQKEDDSESDAEEEEEVAMNDVEDEVKTSKSNKKVDNSKHAKQQEKLRIQTETFEKELLAEKPWQMTGETKSTSRPVNSLLEGTPEFEMASKQAPTITVEHTANLEDVIKKRILQEDWDDVVPRELPDIGWHKKRGELPEVSQEKSKLGLGELYEREYLKKAVGYDKDADEKQTEEGKAKEEMKQLFANLCSKLDALSNYHFAPRPIADEAEVRTVTTPAIAMEEVLPLHVSDARGVAPEEVYGAKRGREGVLRGDNEMDQQDRKRLRQSKKAARRKARKEKLADEKLISRLEPGLGLKNPYEKRKMREELAMARSRGRVTTGEQDLDGKYGSSGTFFKRLQAEAQETIQGKSIETRPPREKPKSKSSTFKL